MEDYKKKYEEALNRAKCYKVLRAEMEIVFPELKESEIRKEIISFLKEETPHYCPNRTRMQELITLFEKQCKETCVIDKKNIDEKIIEAILQIVNTVEPSYILNFFGIDKKDIINWIEKQGKQKSVEWSKEDESYYNSALWHIKHSCGKEGFIYNWLKSLKNRVRQKQEWSEEDKNMIENIFETIDSYYYLIPNYKEKLSWLKYLKERME